jgi:hypothetical protein
MKENNKRIGGITSKDAVTIGLLKSNEAGKIGRSKLGDHDHKSSFLRQSRSAGDVKLTLPKECRPSSGGSKPLLLTALPTQDEMGKDNNKCNKIDEAYRPGIGLTLEVGDSPALTTNESKQGSLTISEMRERAKLLRSDLAESQKRAADTQVSISLLKEKSGVTGETDGTSDEQKSNAIDIAQKMADLSNLAKLSVWGGNKGEWGGSTPNGQTESDDATAATSENVANLDAEISPQRTSIQLESSPTTTDTTVAHSPPAEAAAATVQIEGACPVSYVCSVCGRVFKMQKHLDLHSRSHLRQQQEEAQKVQQKSQAQVVMVHSNPKSMQQPLFVLH